MNHQEIIDAVKLILQHKNEKEVLLGQTFNVFSILKMEKMENATHSAFLAELLNPEGSHLKGNIFLKLFIELNSIKSFDIENAKVTTEYSIGIKDIENESGGRIDIFIQDKEGNCISIENKIDAPDQEKQIARYCNYEHGKNRVFYLTLYDGREPSDYSKLKLKSGEDFICISYEKDILNWLKLCLKECAEQPILRESIRQYIYLINKLTNTMASEDMKKIDELILKNITEVNALSSNFNRVLNEFRQYIREKTIERCKALLGEGFEVYPGGKIDSNAQIWIHHKKLSEYKCQFGIESFSGQDQYFKGIFKSNIFIGVFKNVTEYDSRKPCPYFDGEGEKLSEYWPRAKRIEPINDVEMNLKIETIGKIAKDPMLTDKFIEQVAKQSTDFILNVINNRH